MKRNAYLKQAQELYDSGAVSSEIYDVLPEELQEILDFIGQVFRNHESQLNLPVQKRPQNYGHF